MSARHSVLALVMLGLLLVTSCGPPAPTATPVPATATPIALAATNTPLPPTATPARPTANPIPPTNTPVPPTKTAIPLPTNTPQPTYTPTPLPPLSGSGGGVIAFTSERDGNAEIYVMNADGSDQRRLTNHPFADTSPMWSPDGLLIAFVSSRDRNRDIYIMHRDGSHLRQVTDHPSADLNPAWSPDGMDIGFVSLRDDQAEIYQVGVDGHELQRLTENRYADWEFDWSPDGTQIAISSQKTTYANIYLMNADGSGELRQLTDTEAHDVYPRWSPDGLQIAFVSHRDDNWEIYLMNSDGSDQRRLTNTEDPEGPPSWSPDGSRLVFDSGQEGDKSIYIMHRVGTNVRQLTAGGTNDWGPAWRPDPAALSGYVPLYAPAVCQFDTPAGCEVECGTLTVPEDRNQPGGRMVRMHVAIFRSRNPDPAPDPVIYLTGGGGVDTFDYLPWFLPAFGYAILQDRDLIFFNQRGMHRNAPQLACPGLPELLQRLAAPGPDGEYIDRQEREAQQIKFFADCYANLVAQGIKLEMYDSVTSAADANDLRIALGYDQANYYGSSYGTLLGLLLMRDHPQGARSVVLDSVFPPEASYLNEYGLNAYDTFRQLFDGCAADPQCSQQHPDLEAAFYEVVDYLNANPRTTTWNGRQEVMYDGGAFIDVIYVYLYIGEPQLAIEAIEGASAGDFSMADDMAPGRMDLDSYYIQWGFYRNRDCREEAPFSSFEGYHALMEGLPPQLVEHYRPSLVLGLCEGWEVEPADPIENEPVVSDVPVLVVSGELDPITPPRWAQGAAEHLSNSYVYVFPGFGHGVTRNSACALDIMLQFFDDPTQEPDTSCIDE